MKTDIDLLKDIQPTGDLGAVSIKAEKLISVKENRAYHEQKASEYAEEERQIETVELPEEMDKCGLSEIVMSNGTRFELVDITSASIPSQGSIDRSKGEERNMLIRLREAGFEFLRANGASSLIKNQVEIDFSKDQDSDCDAFVETLKSQDRPFRRTTTVHPKTLNGFIKERLRDGGEVPFDTFRVYTGRKVTVKLGGSHE